MNHSPAQIVASLLYAAGAFGSPADDPLAWPLYISFLPDQDNTPDDCAAITDTLGIKDGRLMQGGEEISHPGLQIRVRAANYDEGWKKIKDAATLLEGVLQAVVVLGADTYTVENVSQEGPVFCIGLEPGTKRRPIFSVNYKTTIKE